VTKQQLEQLQKQAQQLCHSQKIIIHPYGAVWWLVGNGVNLVVRQLKGLSISQLVQRRVVDRPQLAP
jgi:hypothetical protein